MKERKISRKEQQESINKAFGIKSKKKASKERVLLAVLISENLAKETSNGTMIWDGSKYLHWTDFIDWSISEALSNSNT